MKGEINTADAKQGISDSGSPVLIWFHRQYLGHTGQGISPAGKRKKKKEDMVDEAKEVVLPDVHKQPPTGHLVAGAAAFFLFPFHCTLYLFTLLPTLLFER